ncbi:hypothetical protein LEP1GSC162_3021 [Leptospira santarosai str. CBC1531]|nr:hypothetical protein LEP1GSC162_3021 [Leptospira santarosai str. CBC1531]
MIAIGKIGTKIFESKLLGIIESKMRGSHLEAIRFWFSNLYK